MAAVLIIAGGYVILTEDKQSDKKPAEPSEVKEDKPAEIPENNSINQNDSGNNNPEENPYVEKTTEVISKEMFSETEKDSSLSSKNLTQNTKPAFNVGDKLVYKYTVIAGIKPDEKQLHLFDRYEYNTEYSIVDMIRVNKIYYFKIRKETQDYCVGFHTADKEPVIVTEGNKTLYINADTGETFIGVETNNLYDIQKAPENKDQSYWLKSWMFALEDNIKWRESTEEFTPYQMESLQKEVGSKYEQEVKDFSVEGREKINGRECFKVKEEIKWCFKNGGCKIAETKIYYIDVEKRIMVKFENWWENLNLGGVELTDQNIFNKKQ
jgi:hypothetical protein